MEDCIRPHLALHDVSILKSIGSTLAETVWNNAQDDLARDFPSPNLWEEEEVVVESTADDDDDKEVYESTQDGQKEEEEEDKERTGEGEEVKSTDEQGKEVIEITEEKEDEVVKSIDRGCGGERY